MYVARAKQLHDKKQNKNAIRRAHQRDVLLLSDPALHSRHCKHEPKVKSDGGNAKRQQQHAKVVSAKSDRMLVSSYWLHKRKMPSQSYCYKFRRLQRGATLLPGSPIRNQVAQI